MNHYVILSLVDHISNSVPLPIFSTDAHNPVTGANGSIELCHDSCSLLDAGPLVPVLAKMKAWLDANPNEVITIFWENFDKFTPDKFVTAYEASGISSLVWTQAVGSDWPTLATMIAANQRVVNYLDTGANYTIAPWLMAEYDFVFETPFDNQNASQFVCTIDRPSNPTNPGSMMYVMNHFLYGTVNLAGTTIEVPQPGTANVTNSVSSLGTEAQTCLSVFGRVPNYLAVDFYEQGDTFQVVAQLNNVTYVPKRLGGSSSNSGNSTTTIVNNSANGRIRVEWTGAVAAIVGVMAAWVLL